MESTGDIAPHELKHYDVDFYNFELSLRNATQAIQTFFPDTPTFPVLGNHDVYPQGGCSFSGHTS